MSMARLLAPHDVLDDVGGIRTDAGKGGGWLRMQSRQPDGVQPRVRRHAPDFCRFHAGRCRRGRDSQPSCSGESAP
jgi:hypothetical protein